MASSGAETGLALVSSLADTSRKFSYQPEGALEALALLLERSEDLTSASKVWFIRGDYHPALLSPSEEPDTLVSSLGRRCLYEQTSIEAFERLNARAAQVVDHLGDTEGQYDLCLYIGGKQKEENLANFGRGILSLKAQGRFICTMANELGAQRFEKLLTSFGELDVQFSKYHSRVFGIRLGEAGLSEEQTKLAKQWIQLGEVRRSEVSGLFTCPGIFGWNKVDQGSEFLAEQLLSSSVLSKLGPCGVDIGAGNGYLSWRLLPALAKQGKLTRLDLYEQEKLGLQCAKLNLESLSVDTSAIHIGYQWANALVGLPRGQYDWVVMNPPFHQGHSRCLSLGKRFISSAAEALRVGGQLWMVSNRCLPYEDILRTSFKTAEVVAENQGFKVYRACR